MQIFVTGTSTNFTQDEAANNSKVVKNDSIEQINAVQITRLRTLDVQEPINWRDHRFRCKQITAYAYWLSQTINIDWDS